MKIEYVVEGSINRCGATRWFRRAAVLHTGCTIIEAPSSAFFVIEAVDEVLAARPHRQLVENDIEEIALLGVTVVREVGSKPSQPPLLCGKRTAAPVSRDGGSERW